MTLLNGFAGEKEGRCFLASAAACQTVINAIEQWTAGTGLNNPGGAEMGLWEEGRGSAGDHTRLCAVLLTFWLSATVMKLNEQNIPAEKERGEG